MPRLVTWNVNSLRVRLPALLDWAAQARPDILALQETKVPDEIFPADALVRAGYGAGLWRGERAYNGVALLARSGPLETPLTALPDAPVDEARFLAATLEGGIRLVSVYVPNGRSPDSPHFGLKRRWLAALRAWLGREIDRHPLLAVVGDFNIAPEDRDAARPDAWRDSVLTHPELREDWRALLGLGLVDAYRLRNPEGEDYTWWDYRQRAFDRNDGLRIDHVLLSPALAARVESVRVERALRAAERPSDHAPFVVDLRPD